jgi:hypothetical protein
MVRIFVPHRLCLADEIGDAHVSCGGAKCGAALRP